MNDAVKQQVDEIIKRIVEAAKPEKVILFGSYARGEAGPASDLDLLVVESEPFGKARSRVAEIGKLERAIGAIPISTDILVYSRDELERFRHAANHVIFRALREGEVVYDGS
jgi:predicted nucleotidyltransferase